MTAAMVVGMIASAAIFLTATGTTVDQALREHPVLFVAIQALGMTVAMVGWMRFRHHQWRGCAEMGVAMALPAALLICLRLAGTISGEICGIYCLLSFAAMVGVMLYRPASYGGAARVSRAA